MRRPQPSAGRVEEKSWVSAYICCPLLQRSHMVSGEGLKRLEPLGQHREGSGPELWSQAACV